MSTDEYYTPPEYMSAVREVFRGEIDLDSASCERANEIVMAKKYYDKTDNGLLQPYYGKVYNNPPYSKINGTSQAGLWFDKLLDEYLTGTVDEAIFLCNVSTGSKWFQPIMEYATICLVSPRIRFLDHNGIPATRPRYDNCFAYLGINSIHFGVVFSRFGKILSKL